MNASELMTREAVSVEPDTSLAEVWDIMRDLDIRHVPVVERGGVVGMVSDRDLARLNVAAVLATRGADALRRELAAPVAEVMSADVISIDTRTSLADAIDLLIVHKVGALPVVRPGTRELMGILSYIDVLMGMQTRLGEIDG
jgi:acetoin utilization protein AcuB